MKGRAVGVDLLLSSAVAHISVHGFNIFGNPSPSRCSNAHVYNTVEPLYSGHP